MAMSGGSAAPLPPLTVQGIDRLIVGLKNDLTAVNNSAASDQDKQNLLSQINDLISWLKVARSDFANIGALAPAWAPAFTALRTNLVQVHSALVADSGACSYDGGCIVTTRDHCDQLGGSFAPGVDCLGNPLP
jgi:hypothetical protein